MRMKTESTRDSFSPNTREHVEQNSLPLQLLLKTAQRKASYRVRAVVHQLLREAQRVEVHIQSAVSIKAKSVEVDEKPSFILAIHTHTIKSLVTRKQLHVSHFVCAHYGWRGAGGLTTKMSTPNFGSQVCPVPCMLQHFKSTNNCTSLLSYYE